MGKWISILLQSLFLYACGSGLPVPEYYQVVNPVGLDSLVQATIVDLDTINIGLLEWAIFQETNRQRQRLGRRPLHYEPLLYQGAAAHTQEMIDLGYFDHTSPVDENGTVKKRLQQVGIEYGMGGENIAIHPVQKRQQIVFRLTSTSRVDRYDWRNQGTSYTYSELAADLVNRWLISAPHRSNILNRHFRYIGVACAISRYQNTDVVYVTQNFASVNY